MKLKVNLISKKGKYSQKNGVIYRILVALFIILFFVFVFYCGYVILSIYKLNKKILKITDESVAVSTEIRANNENVNKFVLSKGILDYIFEIEKGKFNYKKYLDEIVSILPESTVLRNVDFAAKGWVTAVVYIPNLVELRKTEDRIMDKSIFDQSVFLTGYSEGITKDKTGGYIIKLHLELKKNG